MPCQDLSLIAAETPLNRLYLDSKSTRRPFVQEWEELDKPARLRALPDNVAAYLPVALINTQKTSLAIPTESTLLEIFILICIVGFKEK